MSSPLLKSTRFSLQDEVTQGQFDPAATTRDSVIAVRGSILAGGPTGTVFSNTDNGNEFRASAGDDVREGSGTINQEVAYARTARLESKLLRDNSSYDNVKNDTAVSCDATNVTFSSANGTLTGDAGSFANFVADYRSAAGAWLFIDPTNVTNPGNVKPRRILSATDTVVTLYPEDLSADSQGPLVDEGPVAALHVTIGKPVRSRPGRDGQFKAFNVVQTEYEEETAVEQYEAIRGAAVSQGVFNINEQDILTANFTLVALDFDEVGVLAGTQGTPDTPIGEKLPVMRTDDGLVALTFSDSDLVTSGADVASFSSTISNGATAQGRSAGKNTRSCVATDLMTAEGETSAWAIASSSDGIKKWVSLAKNRNFYAPLGKVVKDKSGNYYTHNYPRVRVMPALTVDNSGRHTLSLSWNADNTTDDQPPIVIQHVSATDITP